MKLIPFFLLPLLLPACSFAQTADSSRHALGFFGETNSLFAGNSNPVMNMAGLQYNKWKPGKHIGYRLILGYGNYNNTPQAGINTINQDTAIGKTTNTKINMVMVGAGVEAQRQFYKKLYFFCGVEIRAGYGSGSTDTTITNEYNAPQIDPFTGKTIQGFAVTSNDKSGTTATLFYLGLTPYFGLKMEFKKFCIGTEFKNYFYHTTTSYSSGKEGNTDFSISNISQSFFVQYKF